MTDFINGFGTILLFLFFLFLGVMYVKNLIKLRDALNVNDFSLITIARIIGAFTFVGGVVMGFV